MLDEINEPSSNTQEYTARWMRHFDKVLSIDREVTKDTVGELEDNSSNQPNDISREEVVKP